MKIAIIGATGSLGTPMVIEALSRGHDVTAVSRSGKPVAGAQGLRLDVQDTGTLAALIGRHDATVFSVPGQEEAHRALIDAGLPGRVLVVGGAGTLRDEDGALVMDGPYFPAEFREHSEQALRVLDAYRASGSPRWTIVSPPPMIAPGERTGSYAAGLDSPAGQSISIEDFAVAMLDEIEHPQHAGERFTVAAG